MDRTIFEPEIFFGKQEKKFPPFPAYYWRKGGFRRPFLLLSPPFGMRLFAATAFFRKRPPISQVGKEEEEKGKKLFYCSIRRRRRRRGNGKVDQRKERRRTAVTHFTGCLLLRKWLQEENGEGSKGREEEEE